MTRQLSVSVTDEIEAPAQEVYAILADYRTHHPHILPANAFKRLVVEEGGIGAGTVFAAEMVALGRTQHFRMRVTEPEPGHVLAEHDLSKELVTTFTVTPLDVGRCTVTIATTWQPAGGIMGWVERLTTPSFMRRIYRAELAQLNRYAQSVTAKGGQ